MLTEKLHGSACLLTYVADERQSAGLLQGLRREVPCAEGGGAEPVLAGDAWARRPEAAARVAQRLGARRVGIFGEVYGAGVQDLTYGADGRRETLGYAVFDVSAEIDGRVRWLDRRAA